MEINELKTLYEELLIRVERLESQVARGTQEKPKRSVFVKPEFEEVYEYMREKLRGTDGFVKSQSEMFVNHYQANGWKVGRVPMKDWKAAIRNWIKNIENKSFNADYTRTAGKKPVYTKNVSQGGFGEL